MILRPFAVILLTALLSIATHAGTVRTDDGSTVNGTVVGVKDGKLTIDTVFAGKLVIPMEKITYIDSSNEMNIQLETGSRLVGTIHRDEGTTTVRTANGPLNVTQDTIEVTWDEGEKDPIVVELESKMRKWRYEAYLDLSGRTGNREETHLGAGFKTIMEGPDDRLELYINGRRSETEGEITSEELIAGMDFEQRFKVRHSWYVRVEQEYDSIEQLDLRSTIAAGYGYYFIMKDHHKLRGRLGTFFRHESYEIREDESTVGLDTGLYHMYQFNDKWRLTNELTYTPSFEDPGGEYRAWHESTFIIPLKHPSWKLQLGVRNEYNTPTGEDIKNLDTYYFARLVLNWD